MIRAYIGEDIIGRSLAISLVEENEGSYPSSILRISEPSSDNATYRWEPIGDPGTEIAPTLRLRDVDARALLEALVRHYNGAEDTRALRRDYDAERKRVDQLVATLGTVVTGLAQPQAERPRMAGAADGPRLTIRNEPGGFNA